MTEQSFPFGGGTAVAEPPAPVLPVDSDEEPDNGNRQKLLAVGAALAVVVVLVAGFMMMKGGSADEASAPVAPSTTTTATNGEAPAHAADKPVRMPKNNKDDIGQDPFKPLVVDQPAAAAGDVTTVPTDTTSSTPGVTVVGSTDGTTTGSTDGTTTGSDTGTTTTTAPVRHPVWIRLSGINSDGDAAVFSVGYGHRKSARVVQYLVTEPKNGEQRIFAHDFALLSVNSKSVLVQFGDAAPFRLSRTNNVMSVA